MNQKVQTQGCSIERLGVALSEFKKLPRPVRRFVLPDVEEYSDFDELLSMFGYGGPVMSDYTAFAATAGVKLSEMKKGALMMLNVRARVKGSFFAEVATATTTKPSSSTRTTTLRLSSRRRWTSTRWRTKKRTRT